VEDKKPDAGTAVKAVQSGKLPIGTVQQILDAAPNDIIEEELEVPEWGVSVKIRSFTAAQNAQIKQRGYGFHGEQMSVAWAEMEILQFQQGVIEPRFDEDQVRTLHLSSGRGFQRVIDRLDQLTGTDKEELRKARIEFQDARKQDQS
jgi:hypothetical protein